MEKKVQETLLKIIEKLSSSSSSVKNWLDLKKALEESAKMADAAELRYKSEKTLREGHNRI